ncbi:MAG: hypothetical protein RLZZ399_613 [Verrucomicrobiota bacterium]|jgi:hypothetical protein
MNKIFTATSLLMLTGWSTGFSKPEPKVEATLAPKPEIPKIITEGLAVYQATGAKEALATWLKGSPVEKDTTTNNNITTLLSQVEGAYGKISGFEPIRLVAVAPSVQRLYFIIKYERGPLYGLFDCFKSRSGWVVNNIEFNIVAKAIVPQAILEGTSKVSAP